MEIFINKRSMRQLRLAVADAIEDGEIDALREELAGLFSDDDIEEIERRIDRGHFYDFISQLLDTEISDAYVDLKYTAPESDDDDEDDDEDEEDDDTEDDLIVDDEDEEL